MIGTTLRSDPAFQGEVSFSFYGKPHLVGSKIAHRLGINGYSTNGENFIKRCGLYALYRTSNKIFTFAVDDTRIALVEDKGTAGFEFTVYSTISLRKLSVPVINSMPFSSWVGFNELNYRSDANIVFSIAGGIFTVLPDNRLYPLISPLGSGEKILQTAEYDLLNETVTEKFGLDYSGYDGRIVMGETEIHSSKLRDMFNIGDPGVTVSEVEFAEFINDIKVLFPGSTTLIQQLETFYADVLGEIQKIKTANTTADEFVTYIDFRVQYEDVDRFQDKRNVYLILALDRIMYKVSKVSVISDIQNFSKAVFFANRLLIFYNNYIYYSSTSDPYDFSAIPTTATPKDIIDKTVAGKLEILKFYNLNGGITNILSLNNFILFTTQDVTYTLTIDPNSPAGMSLQIVSQEGALESGLITLGHEIYKLSRYGLKKLVNYQNYAQLQEIDTTLYQPHIYRYPHIALSYGRYRSEKYIYTLRSDGVVFCHSPIPASVITEYSYYAYTSRFESPYFTIKQIATNFKSGVCSFKKDLSTNSDDNILFIYDHFDCNNDNVLPTTMYDMYDLDNYHYLDLGINDNTVIFDNPVDNENYIYNATAKTLTINLTSSVLAERSDPNFEHKKLKLNDLIRVDTSIDLPVTAIKPFELVLDLSSITDPNDTFIIKLKHKENIVVCGKLYNIVDDYYITLLRNVYKQGETATNMLKIAFDDGNGQLMVDDFDLYNLKPNQFSPFNGVAGCYFSIGLPYSCELGIHMSPLDTRNVATSLTAKLFLTEKINMVNRPDIHKEGSTSQHTLLLNELTHNLLTQNELTGLRDFSHLYMSAEIGFFMGVLGFAIHF